ncbi:MAG: RNA polymerase factor sigma-54 [Spirochaetota bacterium]
MAIGHHLVQRQTQRLVMTQDLRQSIELLPLSNLELSDKIQDELIENPLLEEVINYEKSKSPELLPISEVKNIEKQELQKSSDVSWQDIVALDHSRKNYSDVSDKKQMFIESSPIVSSLMDHLNSQLRLLNLSEEQVRLGEILISMVDEKGFITPAFTEVQEQFGYDAKQIAFVLSQIQQLDPIGIGAKDIKETLTVQARILFPNDTHLHTVLTEYFDCLEKMDYKRIIKALKISEERFYELSSMIKKLEPYPASLYTSRKTDYVIPDVIIKDTENEFTISINDEWLPKLSINQEYKEALLNVKKTIDKEYISNKMSSAQWLIRSINQRRQTLYRVVNSILEFQIDFFRGGISNIKPLTLKDVAEKLNVHESTISRITTNKYIQTSWGIFELKWFFSSSVNSTKGGKESSKKIHDIIKNLVKEEDPENPLSDQEIVDIINSKGIEIARRTVAKYRKVLKILPSNRRKKFRNVGD